MEETTTVSPTFLKGFNQGYQMQQHKPEMSEQLIEQADTKDEYWHGFESGAKEFDIEKTQDKGMSAPAQDKSPDKD